MCVRMFAACPYKGRICVSLYDIVREAPYMGTEACVRAYKLIPAITYTPRLLLSLDPPCSQPKKRGAEIT